MPNKSPKVLLVTYDLKSPETQDGYAPLFETLKASDRWWHYLDSTWLLFTALSPNEMWDRVKDHVNTDVDRLLITEICSPYQGWLAKEAWVWLNERFEEIYTRKKPAA